MILKLLLDLIYSIFNILTLPINIPELPSTIVPTLQEYFQYIINGVSLLDNFIHIGYALTLLGIIIAIDIGVSLYHFIMWIIRKIPMLSMS